MSKDILVYGYNEDDVRISVDEYGYNNIDVYTHNSGTVVVETSAWGIADVGSFFLYLKDEFGKGNVEFEY